MIGDAGPRPPALDLLARAGWEDRAGTALARKLIDESATWDLLELDRRRDRLRELGDQLRGVARVVEIAPELSASRRVFGVARDYCGGMGGVRRRRDAHDPGLDRQTRFLRQLQPG